MRHVHPRIPIVLCLFSLILVGLAAPAAPSAPSQDPTAERFDAARLAWDTGDFVRALDEFKSRPEKSGRAPLLRADRPHHRRALPGEGRRARRSRDSGQRRREIRRLRRRDRHRAHNPRLRPGRSRQSPISRSRGGTSFSPRFPTPPPTCASRANREIDAVRKDIDKLATAATPDRQAQTAETAPARLARSQGRGDRPPRPRHEERRRRSRRPDC